jgi:hypothetical protein
VHADAPDPLYLPSAQATHVVAFVDENVPAAHGVQIDEPVTLIDPVLHASHDACPVASWYRPGEQYAHATDPVAG